MSISYSEIFMTSFATVAICYLHDVINPQKITDEEILHIINRQLSESEIKWNEKQDKIARDFVRKIMQNE